LARQKIQDGGGMCGSNFLTEEFKKKKRDFSKKTCFQDGSTIQDGGFLTFYSKKNDKKQ
jgi:hypothetical protein